MLDIFISAHWNVCVTRMLEQALAHKSAEIWHPVGDFGGIFV